MNAANAINAAYVAVLLMLAAALCRVSRPRRQPTLDDHAPADLPAPVVDTDPGINLALLDECELLYSLPAYTGTDRRRDAIRNQQHKGDQ